MDYQGKTLIDYFEILRKDFKLFLLPFTIILILSILFALTLPSIYRAQGTILVESQQIPDDLIRSTIRTYADERIQIIKQLVMTRENLLRIINKYNLYKKMNGKEQPPVHELLDRIRKNIYIHLTNELQQNIRFTNRPNSITFIVAYEHENPAIAQNVANELVTLFLQENMKTRTARATETTEFLTSEAEKLRIQINRIEMQVAEFKQKNEQSLPENLDLNTQMLERAQSSLREIERDIKSEEEQLSYLEVQLASLQLTVPDDENEPLTPKQHLTLLRSQLTELSNRYGPEHPDLRKLRHQIHTLEKEISTSGDDVTGIYSSNPATMLIEAKIRASKDKILSLQKQEKELRNTISELQKRIMQTPYVERGLKALERDYDNLKEKYDDLIAKATEATLSQSMEEQSKAERFTLIEPPVFPEKPIRPNRKKLLLLGFILSLASGIALVIALDELKGGIRNIRQLTRLTKITPLVSIGYIENEQDVIHYKQVKIRTILLLTILIFSIMTIIHFAYKPLDEIVKIIAKRF